MPETGSAAAIRSSRHSLRTISPSYLPSTSYRYSSTGWSRDMTTGLLRNDGRPADALPELAAQKRSGPPRKGLHHSLGQHRPWNPFSDRPVSALRRTSSLHSNCTLGVTRLQPIASALWPTPIGWTSRRTCDVRCVAVCAAAFPTTFSSSSTAFTSTCAGAAGARRQSMMSRWCTSAICSASGARSTWSTTRCDLGWHSEPRATGPRSISHRGGGQRRSAHARSQSGYISQTHGVCSQSDEAVPVDDILYSLEHDGYSGTPGRRTIDSSPGFSRTGGYARHGRYFTPIAER